MSKVTAHKTTQKTKMAQNGQTYNVKCKNV